MADDWEEELAIEQEKEKKEEEEKKKEEQKKKEEEKKKKEEQKKKEEERKKEEEKKKKEEEEKKKNQKPDANNLILKTEKDFLELATINASKIKKANPLPIFTLSYLKNIVELLGPTLDVNQINEILNLTNKVFNQKLKEGEKIKNISKKASINVGKMNVKNGVIEDHDDDYDDDNEEEEEEEEQDVNIDSYIK